MTSGTENNGISCCDLSQDRLEASKELNTPWRKSSKDHSGKCVDMIAPVCAYTREHDSAYACINTCT